jgi:hypothetical protein
MSILELAEMLLEELQRRGKTWSQEPELSKLFGESTLQLPIYHLLKRGLVETWKFGDHPLHLRAISPQTSRQEPQRATLTQGSVQGDPPLSIFPMTRREDYETSEGAAQVVLPHIGSIQRKVLATIREKGPMDARKMERLPEYSSYGHSTIRKRIGELARGGYLKAVDIDRTGRAPITVWDITGLDLEEEQS